MDSTQINHTASKLPIKRKTHDEPTSQNDASPSPPFKFQRVWSESDEIRFLQGLLDSASDGLSLPRDLSIFYDRFSKSTPQPYTKSQLYEKMRRLKKKFRTVTCRISKGLDPSRLSAHDRELYEMSRRLWHEDSADMSPFGKAAASSDGGLGERRSLVGVKVDFSPTLPVASNDDVDLVVENEFGDAGGLGFGPSGAEHRGSEGFCGLSEANAIETKKSCAKRGPEKLSEVAVEVEEGEKNRGSNASKDGGLGKVVANAVMRAFDECMEDLRHKIDAKECGKESLWLRWQRQKVDEYDVLARRARLVLEDFIRKQ